MQLTPQERAVTVGLCAILWIGLVIQMGLHGDWKMCRWMKATPVAVRPVSVNTATAEALLAVPGIGPKTAQFILEERAKRPFQTLEPLLQARGMTPERYERLRRYLRP